MVGRPRVCATAVQCVELRSLALSNQREEADRARAILLSVEGWTSARLGEVFGVHPDTVRHWRTEFAAGGVAALRRRVSPGPEPIKARAALAVAEAVLSVPVSDRPNWTLPRLVGEIERRTGVRISKSRLSVVLRKKGAFAGAAPGTA